MTHDIAAADKFILIINITFGNTIENINLVNNTEFNIIILKYK